MIKDFTSKIRKIMNKSENFLSELQMNKFYVEKRYRNVGEVFFIYA